MKPQSTIHTFRDKSGRKVHVRRLLPDDAPYLVDIFEHMGSESRYRRFHQTVDRVSDQRMWHEAETIAHGTEYVQTGLIAFADLLGQRNAPVGVARYVSTEPREAEVAISVRDDMHGQGIGTQLMRLLTDEAFREGYVRLTATILNDNPAIWRVFDKLPYKVLRMPEGNFSNIMIVLRENEGAEAPVGNGSGSHEHM